MQQHCHIGDRILREDSHIRQAFFQWRGVPVADEDGDVRESLPGNGGLGRPDAPREVGRQRLSAGTGRRGDSAGGPHRGHGRRVRRADLRTSVQGASTEAEALDIIRDAAGSHFDPQVYAAFLEALPAIRRIRRRFADGAIAPDTKDLHDETDLVCR